MKPIQTESKGIKPIKYGGGNDLAYYTYLQGCRVPGSSAFLWNYARSDLAHDRNENKHYFMAKRMIERGGRRDIFPGCSRMSGLCGTLALVKAGYYDDYPQVSFGMMFHGFDYQ